MKQIGSTHYEYESGKSFIIESAFFDDKGSISYKSEEGRICIDSKLFDKKNKAINAFIGDKLNELISLMRILEKEYPEKKQVFDSLFLSDREYNKEPVLGSNCYAFVNNIHKIGKVVEVSRYSFKFLVDGITYSLDNYEYHYCIESLYLRLIRAKENLKSIIK